MQPTDPTDPDAPEFAPIRGELARLFILHKAEMGMADASDAMVIDNVSTIAAALYFLSMDALKCGDEAWQARHEWWRVACGRLFDDEPVMQLDG